MQYLSDSISYVNNLPPTKKLILIIIFIVLIIFIIDALSSVMKYTDITNHSKENMAGVDISKESNYTDSNNFASSNLASSDNLPSSDSNSNMIPFRDIMINSDVLNITLFYADWCGHCKRFMKETWGQLKEKFGSNKDVQLNQIDCTNVKSAIETPAGKSIEGFPTVILNYKDKDGKYIEEEYNGPRSLDVMSSIIDKFTNSSTPTNM